MVLLILLLLLILILLSVLPLLMIAATKPFASMHVRIKTGDV